MHARRAWAWAPLLVTSLLGACVAPRPTQAPLDGVAARALLEQVSRFEFEGRVGISTGSGGHNATLRWQQRDARSVIRLSGPLGAGSTEVQVEEDDLIITTGRGEPLRGDAARAALATQLGMEPPLAALRYWMRGLPAPGGNAQEILDSAGRLAALEQQGWTVRFEEYRPHASRAGGLSLPRRITATSESLRMRLVIDRWTLDR